MSGGTVVGRGQRWPAVAVAGLAWLVGMFTFYREALSSGFEVLHGGDLDQRLLIYLSEHWYQVVGGEAPWRDPSAFYPVADDLGYTDALALFQVAYVPLRWLGLDQFVAFEVTLMVLTTIGFVATLVLVRCVMRVHFGVSVIAAFAFAFGNPIAVQTQHGQLMTIELVPVVALGVAGSIAMVRRHRRWWAGALAGATGALVGLILFTSYYVGWTMIALAALATVCVAACTPTATRQTMTRLRGRAGHLALLTGCAVAGLAVALIPFAITYTSALEVSGGRTFDEVAYFTPRLANLARFGDGNLLWGQVVPPLPGVTTDVVAVPAPTPVLAMTAIIGVIVMLIHARGRADLSPMRRRLQVASGLLLASLLATLASVRIGDWTAWRWVWEFVPGATAIRVPGRLGLMTALLVVMAWALAADAVWSTIRPWFTATATTTRRIAAGAIAMAGVLVAVEQVQTNSVHDLIRSEQRALVDNVGSPPPGCSAFYVVNPLPANAPWVDQMDALLVSHAAGIPTLNGYSGLTPPDWTLNDPGDPGYALAAQAWIQRHNLTDTVCTYAVADGQWSPAPPQQ